MGWLKYPKRLWRQFGLALSLIGAAGLFAPQLGFSMFADYGGFAMGLLLIGLFINVANG